MPPGRPIPRATLAAKRDYFRGRRTFGPDDLDALLEVIKQGREAVPVGEVVRTPPEERDGLVALRHDVDHDVENALRFASWERENGLRSTYYVLHTDWYYRASKRGQLSPLVLNCLNALAEMGHEIGLHNNVIAAALMTGDEPEQILERELDHLRRVGFDVTGTVAHGDPLCRQAGFVNSEIFLECPRPTLGDADREIRHPDYPAPVRLHPRAMADFGLTHEAGFIGHRTYLSDTGGRWSVAPSGVIEQYRRIGGVLQVLTHPVWWALDGELVRGRAPRTPEDWAEVSKSL